MIWESFLDKTVDVESSPVMSWRRLKILPSLLDLREEVKPGLKRPKLKQKSSKTLQEMQILRQKKHPLILKKPHLRPKEPKNYAAEAKHSTEEAKVILLKNTKSLKTKSLISSNQLLYCMWKDYQRITNKTTYNMPFMICIVIIVINIFCTIVKYERL